MKNNEELQKVIDEYKEFLRQEKLILELNNFSDSLRKSIEENVRDLELEINWLEEIQAYRAIGTVEELQKAKEQYDDIHSVAEKIALYGLCGYATAKEAVITEMKRSDFMTISDALEILQGKLDCMKKCYVFDCKNSDECDNCKYLYAQGTYGKQIKAFELILKFFSTWSDGN